MLVCREAVCDKEGRIYDIFSSHIYLMAACIHLAWSNACNSKVIVFRKKNANKRWQCSTTLRFTKHNIVGLHFTHIRCTKEWRAIEWIYFSKIFVWKFSFENMWTDNIHGYWYWVSMEHPLGMITWYARNAHVACIMRVNRLLLLHTYVRNDLVIYFWNFVHFERGL